MRDRAKRATQTASERQDTFMYSFVPRSVRVWNSLPEQIVTAPMRPFKNSVTQYLDL